MTSTTKSTTFSALSSFIHIYEFAFAEVIPTTRCIMLKYTAVSAYTGSSHLHPTYARACACFHRSWTNRTKFVCAKHTRVFTRGLQGDCHARAPVPSTGGTGVYKTSQTRHARVITPTHFWTPNFYFEALFCGHHSSSLLLFLGRFPELNFNPRGFYARVVLSQNLVARNVWFLVA